MFELLLAPLMRVWYRSVSARLSAVPCPTDPPQCHASGEDADRVLIFGNGPALGFGVLTHELALPGQLARALSARTRRGADVYAKGNRELTIKSAVAGLAGARLDTFDAIVVTLGISDACMLTSRSVWPRGLRDLLAALSDRTAPGTAIVMTGIQPIRRVPQLSSPIGVLAALHARRLNRCTRQLVAEFPEVSYLSLRPQGASASAPPGTARAYEGWAGVLARHLDAAISGPTATPEGAHPGVLSARAVRALPPDEVERQRAFGSLQLRTEHPNPVLQRIVAHARSAFGTPFAAISLIDDDRQIYAARSGFTLTEVDRALSFCDHTIRTSALTIVPEERADARFARNPLVTAADGVRFYAGFPIESPDGHRIGALCVFDTQPRQGSAVLRRLLRDLALMAQKEFAVCAQQAPISTR